MNLLPIPWMKLKLESIYNVNLYGNLYLIFNDINDSRHVEHSIPDVQVVLEKQPPFSRRIIPHIAFMPPAGIAPQHVGWPPPVRDTPVPVRIGFHQGVHEFICYRNAGFHSSLFVDRA